MNIMRFCQSLESVRPCANPEPGSRMNATSEIRTNLTACAIIARIHA